MNKKIYIESKIKELAKLCFKNDKFGFDFIKKILISIVLKKSYYINVHDLHINVLKSILKTFDNFNFFTIDMNHVENINDVSGYPNTDGKIDSIGYAPRAEIVILDKIWDIKPNLINTFADLTSTNNYHLDNLILESKTKIIIATANFTSKPSLKHEKLWSAFFIKDQYLSKIEDLDDILNLDNIEQDQKIDLDDLDFISKNFASIFVSEEIFEKIVKIHEKITLANLPFENRNASYEQLIFDEKTWRQVINAVKINSLIEGRNQVNNEDLFIIIPIVCSIPIQYDVVEKIINDVIFDDAFDEQDFHDSENGFVDDEPLMEDEKLSSHSFKKDFPLDEIKKIDQEIDEIKNENITIIPNNYSQQVNNLPRIYDEKFATSKIIKNDNFVSESFNNDPFEPIVFEDVEQDIQADLDDIINEEVFIKQDVGNNKPRFYDENKINNFAPKNFSNVPNEEVFIKQDVGNNKPRFYDEKKINNFAPKNFSNVSNEEVFIKQDVDNNKPRFYDEKKMSDSIQADIEQIINEEVFIKQDVGNNKPRFYDDKKIFEKAQEKILPQIQSEPIEQHINAFFEQNKKSDSKRIEEIKKLEEIANGTYESYRKMVFSEIEGVEALFVTTHKKMFQNDVGTFYLASDQDDESFMVDVKSFERIDHQKNKGLVLTCTKSQFYSNDNQLNNIFVFWEDDKYFIKKDNQKNWLAFVLTESNNDVITPNILSIRKIQRFMQEGKFLQNHLNGISEKLKKILDQSAVENADHKKANMALTNIAIVNSKIKTFLKWLKNSSASQASVKLFLPEYSSV